jgi:hypothetical protein
MSDPAGKRVTGWRNGPGKVINECLSALGAEMPAVPPSPEQEFDISPVSPSPPKCGNCAKPTTLLTAIGRVGDAPVTYWIFECRSCNTLEWIAEKDQAKS